MDLSNHIITNIEYSDPAWLRFRLNGIGGSEINVLFGDVCGNEYNDPTKLFYQKIGMVDPWTETNEAMFWGRELEKEVAQKWQFWSGDKESYIKNFETDNIVRKCRKLNGYVQNKEFDWLFASVDRIINIGFTNLLTGEISKKEGVLEVKTISGFNSDKWLSGIPTAYILQCTQYMLILGLDYCEMALLRDGRFFEVIPLGRSESLCDQILSRSQEFWHKRVVPGKQLFQEYQTAKRFSKTSAMEKAEAAIVSLEPAPVAGESYRKFLSERFTAERVETPGNSFQLALLKQYEVLNYIKKHFEGESSLIYNSILSEFDRNKTNKLDFGAEGYARYGKRLTNKVKADFDKDALNKDLNALNIEY